MRSPLNRSRQSERRGIPLRALPPNAVTALALCFGLTGVRFAIAAAQSGDTTHWMLAVAMIAGAGVLDGLDGRIARLLNGQSRFGAELDSLSDVIAFGVSPAVILYLWILQTWPKFGWIVALSHAVCCALRLARFNSSLDAEEQPMKSAGFLTGVPAPTGAGMTLLPIILWLASGRDELRSLYVVAPWTLLCAFLMVSSIATYSWGSIRLRREWRLALLVVVALVGGSLVTAPWITASALMIVYAVTIPFSARSYARIRRQRAAARAHPGSTPAAS